MTSGAGNNKNHQQGKRTGRSRIAVMVVMLVLAVILVIIAVLCVLYRIWVIKPELPAHPDPVSSTDPAPAVSEGNEQQLDPVQEKVNGDRKSEDYYTILVFGADESSGLTDTIMVVSYDVTNQQATAMSIPRDTIINSSAQDVGSKLINAVYKRNGGGETGITALKNEVAELVGFMPDYYVMINWELVGQMVDAIGGVWFDVPYRMKYDDPAQDLHINQQAGYRLLTGDDAMQLVRWRKNNDGSGVSDITRLSIQHSFLKAVLKQTLQLTNITKVNELAELFGENVVSDLTINNLIWFGSQAIFGGLDVDNVNFVTMPYLGTTAAPYNQHVYPDWDKLLELINNSLNPYLEDVTLQELDLIRVNADGSLSSSTGVLADPSAGIARAFSEAEINDGG